MPLRGMLSRGREASAVMDANTLGLLLIALATVAAAVAILARRRARPGIAGVAGMAVALILVALIVVAGSAFAEGWFGGIG